MKILQPACIRFFKLILVSSLMLAGSLCAQPANKAMHDRSAEMIRTLYNQKKFTELYGRLSPNFQSAMKRKEFIDFLDQSLYAPLGEMQQLTYLNNEQGLFAYVAYFKSTLLRMNLLVNDKEQIEGLQFLPYTAPVKTKVLNYDSDNKKQSPLDLLVDSVVKSYMQSPQNCGLSIGISKNGQTFFYNYGETSRDNHRLPQVNTIYEIGSITKTFCGLLLAQAILDKKIKPDDDIRRYLDDKYPNLEYENKPILVKHLANHTSGLPSVPEDLVASPGFDSLNPYKNYSRQQMLGYLKTMKLKHVPGTSCDYSNFGMALLGLILEDLYHQPFETLVKEKICLPNQMNSTGIALSNEERERFAEGYNQDGVATPHWELNGFAAAGALHSTSLDMLRYFDYNLAEKDAATRLAHTATFSNRQTLGLAWFIKKTKQGNTLLWHNGGTYGFSSFGGCVKEKNCSIIILSNSAINVDYIGISILNYLQQ